MRNSRREVLTDEEIETIREHEANHDFDNPEYQELIAKVYAKRFFREERPIWAEKVEANMEIYELIWGPTELALAETARLRDWSINE